MRFVLVHISPLVYLYAIHAIPHERIGDIDMYPCINGWTKEKMKAAIVAHNNGTRAVRAGTNYCEYETDTGNRCAIGCLLPKEWFLKAVDAGDKSASGLAAAIPGLDATLPLEDINALNNFQRIHDGWEEKDGTLHSCLFRWIDENVTDESQAA